MAEIKYRFERESYLAKPKKTGKGKFFFIFFIVILLMAGMWFLGSKLFSDKENASDNQPKQEDISVNSVVSTTSEENANISETQEGQIAQVTADTPKVEEQIPPEVALIDPEYEKDLAQLKEYYAKTDYQKVKQLALEMLKKYGEADKSGPIYRKIGKLLSRLNIKMLFEGIPNDKLAMYKVDFGDNLNNIAIKYNLPITAIVKANNLKTTTIYPGQMLKIYQGKWSIQVNKVANLLYVFDGDELFCMYDVGIGKEGRTPEGEFKLTDKIEHPDWYSPDGRIVPYGDKENVLGTHWLKLEPINNTDSYHIGYGIHGTWDTGEIAQSLSNGCIRMRNQDVTELFCYIPRQVIVTIY